MKNGTFTQLYSLYLFKLVKYIAKNCCIKDIWSIITFETKVVIENSLTVRKSC